MRRLEKIIYVRDLVRQFESLEIHVLSKQTGWSQATCYRVINDLLLLYDEFELDSKIVSTVGFFRPVRYKYTAEFKDRAVKLFYATRYKYKSKTGAMDAVSNEIGCALTTLREWLHKDSFLKRELEINNRSDENVRNKKEKETAENNDQ